MSRVEPLGAALFEDLTAEHMKLLASLCRRLRFVSGEIVFNEGDRVENLYVLEAGEVVIRFFPYDGGFLDIATIRPGGVFGWSAALGRGYYTSSAICLSEVRALAISGEALRAVMCADPSLGMWLLERLAQAVANRFDGIRPHLVKLLKDAADASVETDQSDPPVRDIPRARRPRKKQRASA